MRINLKKLEIYSIKTFSLMIGLTTGWIGYIFCKELLKHLERRRDFRKNLERIKWRKK